MPTYDYICDNCQHEFEQFQSITASQLKKCPACGKMKLRRLIGSGAGVIFKGSGFYETDYRSKSYNSGKQKEKGGASTTKTEPKSNSKTEAKSESKSSDSKAAKPSKPADKKKTA